MVVLFSSRYLENMSPREPENMVLILYPNEA